MKYGHLERFKVELTVQSPVFIGSGEKLRAKEIIMDYRQRIIHIPSLLDMVESLLNSWKRGLSDDYIRFVTDPNQKRLSDFLSGHGISLTPLPAWVKYTISIQSDASGVNTLSTFTKNEDGLPYIPGTSIKGAIRTALIAARMNERDKQSLWKELEEKPKNRGTCVAERVMRILPNNKDFNGQIRNDAVNDLLRAIEISDSAPIDPEALTVCRRHWISADGEDRPTRSPLFMECLIPGAKTCFYLTVDHSQWPTNEDVITTIRAALTDWDSLCYRVHESFFAHELASPSPKGGVPIILGGGTGFHRKSLVYRARNYPEESVQLAHSTLRLQFPRTYKPSNRAKTAPYMFKAADFEGRLYPMGACELKL